MGETSEQIELHIRETRDDLGQNIGELEERVRTSVDWRAQCSQRPMTMVALAFGGGVLLSALLAPKRVRHAVQPEGPGEAPAEAETPAAVSQPRVVVERRPSQARQNWAAFKGALAGVATSKLSGFIEELLPGFKQEFTSAQAGRPGDRPGTAASSQPAWRSRPLTPPV